MTIYELLQLPLCFVGEFGGMIWPPPDRRDAEAVYRD